MSMRTFVFGRLVGATSSDYDFEDSGVRRRGTARRLYVSGGFSERPVEVRVPDEAEAAGWFDEAKRAGFGTLIQAECALRVYRSEQTLKLIGPVTLAEDPEAA